MTVQEARAVRCAELQESEASYTEALRETAAKMSRECTSLHQEHAEHMRDLEAQAIRSENRSHQDFLLMHQMLLHQAPNSVKEDLYFSYSLLLGSSLPHPHMHAIQPSTPGRSESTLSHLYQTRA